MCSRCCAPGASRSGPRSTASSGCSPSASARRTRPRSRAGRPGSTSLCHIAGLGPGDEVITSPFAFVATANCFIFEGATPVFADVDPQTLNLDPAASRPRHRPDEGDRRRRHVRLPLRARRAARDRRPAWAGGDRRLLRGARRRVQGPPRSAPTASPPVFGFYPNKQITTGEGGIVTTHSEDERDLLVSLRNQGRSYENRWFHHVRLGFNYRFTDLQAAVGLAQLEKLDRILALRRGGGGPLHGRARRRRRGRSAARRRREPRSLLVRLRREARPRASTATR